MIGRSRLGYEGGNGHVRLLGSIAGYRREWLSGDLVAGLTVAAYLVPQVMAYAGVAGVPPVVGLWSVVPAMSLYVVLGSSRQLSVGPESTTALMAAVAIGPLSAGDASRHAALTAGLALLVGLACLIAWLLRLGFVSDLLSKPVLIGYLAGVALIMMIGQLHRTTGVPVRGDTIPQQLSSFVRHLGDLRLETLWVAAAVLAFLIICHRRWPRLPSPLLAVLLAAAAVAAFDLSTHGVSVVGQVPAGLPVPDVPNLSWNDFRQLLAPAIGVAVVGYTDNMLTARAFADRGNYSIDPNRELLALGAANLGSGLFRGIPVSSSGSRTALGNASGSRTQLFSAVAVVVVLVVLLVGGSVLENFPDAALGAIIVFAAWKLIDFGEFRRLARFRRSELLLALVATVGVLLVDILYGVLIAIGLSVADMLRRVARPHDAILGQVPGLAGMHDVDDYPTAKTIRGLVVYRYDSPLFFANAEDFKRRALAAVTAEEDPRWFVLNVEAYVEVDITGLDALEWLRSELQRHGVVMALARVKQDLRHELVRFGIAKSIGEDRLYPTLPTAVAAYKTWLRTQGDRVDD